MDKKFYGIFIAILIVVAGGIYWAATLQEGNQNSILGEAETGPGTVGERVAFAQCLADKGAKFYGAWWCPHCADQKALFGEKAMKRVSYVECALPSKQMNNTCKAKGIEGYPTWIFADGTQKVGVLTFEALSEQTGCVAPQEAAADNDQKSAQADADSRADAGGSGANEG